MPALTNELPNHPGPAGMGEISGSEASVALPDPQEEQESVFFNLPVAHLPVELDVSVAVREFRVQNLLALEPGQVIETQWSHGVDVPLSSGEVQLAWSEFEVVDSQLAVRITRLP